ncbi:hypothetical protein ROZALSC1DRAFT_27123 [Rozella allomycis CSF55]|uniref:F-box domain-containing protein n=1 Tax=Rozella allomycis (strain CSF55) TaxID=988480 RepID=A0A075AZT9_ROZAC|nr:hypothetical protein O9G_003574 [Rozella allomycis CSF55]RKP21481.1 hypothetical protein ROZALSC1DRAFT_27123 [Rozella allomycis CSF55]|eukprot:EPZ35856.1 hypothetical protein O9G_003574 [Rozella allomycis CSF55]
MIILASCIATNLLAKKGHIHDLSEETVSRICYNLDVSSFFRFQRTCKRFHKSALENQELFEIQKEYANSLKNSPFRNIKGGFFLEDVVRKVKRFFGERQLKVKGITKRINFPDFYAYLIANSMDNCYLLKTIFAELKISTTVKLVEVTEYMLRSDIFDSAGLDKFYSGDFVEKYKKLKFELITILGIGYGKFRLGYVDFFSFQNLNINFDLVLEDCVERSALLTLAFINKEFVRSSTNFIISQMQKYVVDMENSYAEKIRGLGIESRRSFVFETSQAKPLFSDEMIILEILRFDNLDALISLYKNKPLRVKTPRNLENAIKLKSVNILLNWGLLIDKGDINNEIQLNERREIMDKILKRGDYSLLQSLLQSFDKYVQLTVESINSLNLFLLENMDIMQNVGDFSFFVKLADNYIFKFKNYHDNDIKIECIALGDVLLQLSEKVGEQNDSLDQLIRLYTYK